MKKLNFGDKQKVFYIADTHFGHNNIIHHCNRPFKSIEEMNRTMIENWNKVVQDKDIVIIVGDFTFRGAPAEEYLKMLKGKKYLILGNHDSKQTNGFEGVYDMALVKHNGRKIHLCHYPLMEWDGYFRNTYHFFGHIHNSKNRAAEIMSVDPHAFNVGADIIGFTPRTADEIITGC